MGSEVIIIIIIVIIIILFHPKAWATLTDINRQRATIKYNNNVVLLKSEI